MCTKCKMKFTLNEQDFYVTIQFSTNWTSKSYQETQSSAPGASCYSTVSVRSWRSPPSPRPTPISACYVDCCLRCWPPRLAWRGAIGEVWGQGGTAGAQGHQPRGAGEGGRRGTGAVMTEGCNNANFMLILLHI